MLSSEGLNSYAFLGPLLPVLEHEDVHAFIDRLAGTGVQTVMVDTLNLKPGIWPSIEKALEGFPEIKNKFQERLFNNKNYYPMIIDKIRSECLRQGLKVE